MGTNKTNQGEFQVAPQKCNKYHKTLSTLELTKGPQVNQQTCGQFFRAVERFIQYILGLNTSMIGTLLFVWRMERLPYKDSNKKSNDVGT